MVQDACVRSVRGLECRQNIVSVLAYICVLLLLFTRRGTLLEPGLYIVLRRALSIVLISIAHFSVAGLQTDRKSIMELWKLRVDKLALALFAN